MNHAPLLHAMVRLANQGTQQVLHPVMMAHFEVGLHEMERLLRHEGLTFHRRIMTFGGVRRVVSGPDEPVERVRVEPGNRMFGLVVNGR